MERRSFVRVPNTYHRRLAVICPVCGKRVCDISPKSKLDAFSQDDVEKPPWDPEVYGNPAGKHTQPVPQSLK